jgi:hypothetical protein
LTIVADSDRDVSNAEFGLLEQLAVHEQLGLEDEYTLAELMHEIDGPQLRHRVLDLCVKIAEVDGNVAQAESIVLVAAAEHWGLQR